jgi:trehalose 6-phosphate synthase
VERESRGLEDVIIDDHTARIGTFPIGIDFPTISRVAAGEDVTASVRRLRLDLGHRALILGVDRLDYTKGIPQRLLAFEHLLASSPELHDRITFLQIVEPSRELVTEYQELKTEIDRLVGAINGRFGTPAWVPVRYIYRGVGWPDLLALYRIANVALITPLKDGMNLVAKEYCACQIDEPGALVLSEFAGAAAQLHEHASLVNPYDAEGTGREIAKALALGPDTRAERMSALRQLVEREDVFWWCRRFLRAFEESVEDIPGRDAYMPDLSASEPPLHASPKS